MAAWSREALGAVGRGDAAAADALAGYAVVVEDAAAAVVASVIIAQSSELTELAPGARASGSASRLAVAALQRVTCFVRSRAVLGAIACGRQARA
jgi:hypothetical protein